MKVFPPSANQLVHLRELTRGHELAAEANAYIQRATNYTSYAYPATTDTTPELDSVFDELRLGLIDLHKRTGVGREARALLLMDFIQYRLRDRIEGHPLEGYDDAMEIHCEFFQGLSYDASNLLIIEGLEKTRELYDRAYDQLDQPHRDSIALIIRALQEDGSDAVYDQVFRYRAHLQQQRGDHNSWGRPAQTTAERLLREVLGVTGTKRCMVLGEQLDAVLARRGHSR